MKIRSSFLASLSPVPPRLLSRVSEFGIEISCENRSYNQADLVSSQWGCSDRMTVFRNDQWIDCNINADACPMPVRCLSSRPFVSLPFPIGLSLISSSLVVTFMPTSYIDGHAYWTIFDPNCLSARWTRQSRLN